MHTCVKIGEGLRCKCKDEFILAKDGKRCNKGTYPLPSDNIFGLSVLLFKKVRMDVHYFCLYTHKDNISNNIIRELPT